jgi:hypothetical protein
MGYLDAPDGRIAQLTSNALTVGEETLPRELIVSTGVNTSTGSLRLGYFTARKSETTTQVRVVSGSTAAGATPTLVRVGLFDVATNGNLTLIASTVNDTAVFAAATTIYTRSWSASVAKVAGHRYALGILIVTAAAVPTLMGQSIQCDILAAPLITSALSGQTDMPSSITAGSLASSGVRPYAAILP